MNKNNKKSLILDIDIDTTKFQKSIQEKRLEVEKYISYNNFRNILYKLIDFINYNNKISINPLGNESLDGGS
jgi:hypothetical protein